MLENSSVANESGSRYPEVRLCASTISFILLAFFNVVINFTIVSEERLRTQARFVLIFHLLFSGLVYFCLSSAFYLQKYMRFQISKASCLTLITILMTSASNILLTLTAMALDRYIAICFPLKYSALCGRHQPWLLGAATWLLALLIPLYLVTQDAQPDYQAKCTRAQMQDGQLLKILLISCCTCLILYSYAKIIQEGRRIGVVNKRNRIGRKTILMHGAQLAVYILPNFVLYFTYLLASAGYLDSKTRDLFGEVNFAFFSLAQCISPVIYGLRKEDLLEQLYHKFPCLSCNLKGVLEWMGRTASFGRCFHIR
ncbi:odorant receptor 131-2-like [Polyodon spathula]|uniref:odorant receptor 131-2-like n=1 Tax=Polyodon spathula TaxID=7913 RepID=UPI001B7F0C06|nr:odorant receptor 131-2-like [Polyodon spathula]